MKMTGEPFESSPRRIYLMALRISSRTYPERETRLRSCFFAKVLAALSIFGSNCAGTLMLNATLGPVILDFLLPVLIFCFAVFFFLTLVVFFCFIRRDVGV